MIVRTRKVTPLGPKTLGYQINTHRTTKAYNRNKNLNYNVMTHTLPTISDISWLEQLPTPSGNIGAHTPATEPHKVK